MTTANRINYLDNYATQLRKFADEEIEKLTTDQYARIMAEVYRVSLYMKKLMKQL